MKINLPSNKIIQFDLYANFISPGKLDISNFGDKPSYIYTSILNNVNVPYFLKVSNRNNIQTIIDASETPVYFNNIVENKYWPFPGTIITDISGTNVFYPPMDGLYEINYNLSYGENNMLDSSYNTYYAYVKKITDINPFNGSLIRQLTNNDYCAFTKIRAFGANGIWLNGIGQIRLHTNEGIQLITYQDNTVNESLMLNNGSLSSFLESNLSIKYLSS